MVERQLVSAKAYCKVDLRIDVRKNRIPYIPYRSLLLSTIVLNDYCTVTIFSIRICTYVYHYKKHATINCMYIFCAYD